MTTFTEQDFADTDWLQGQSIIWMNRWKPWEEPDFERVTILGRTDARVRVLTIDNKTKLVKPSSLRWEESK